MEVHRKRWFSAGISVSTMDLSDVFGRAARIADDDSRVKAKIAEIADYAATEQVPGSSLTRMAKLGVVLLEWMDQNGLDASAIQCWSSMQQNLPCQRLHRDEQDERTADAERLPGGYRRRGCHVRVAACFRASQRPGRLEQQLRR